jgi:TPR repeat protein
MARNLAYLVHVGVLVIVGYLFGILTGEQRERELARWFGGEAGVAGETEPGSDAAPGGGAGAGGSAHAPGAGTAAPPGPAAGPHRDAASGLVPEEASDQVRDLAAAALAGDAEAQFDLAVAYDYGDGVRKDDGEAARWYRRAAEQGHPSAQNDLGYLYETGEGVGPDMAEAVRWYRRAAGQGLALAQNNLGLLHQSGKGVERDDGAAAQWFRRAAEQGHHGAQHNLAILYDEGRGVAHNGGEALKWYRLAAEDGEAASNNSLAWFLATAPEDRLRDGGRAVEAAGIAVGLEPENPNYLDTLAAALAEAGRFDEAITAQERAVTLLANAGEDRAAAEFSTRLGLYRAGRPARR